MKKKLPVLFVILFLLLSPAFGPRAAAYHGHVDEDGAPTLIQGYRAPTETEDGSSGDEVCSVCGALITAATRIPSLREQRGDPTDPPEPMPENHLGPTEPSETMPSDPPAPTDPPGTVQTDPPATTDPPETTPPDPPVSTNPPVSTDPPVPTDPPAFTDPPEPPPSVTPEPTAIPDPTFSPAPTQVPTPVSPPSPAPPPTEVPTPVVPVTDGGGANGAGGPTPQPTLTDEEILRALEGLIPSSRFSRNQVRTGSSGGTKAGSSARTSVSSGLQRGFSSRFPWRRLRMTPAAGIVLPLAGIPVWNVQEASSPLMTLTR